MLKSLVKQLRDKELGLPQLSHLRGWVSYLRSVEPSFVTALEQKYGLDLSANSTWD